MFIAGTQRWKITIAEPEALRIALYVRDVAGLEPVTEPQIPPLDPPADVWPVWSRRPVEVQSSGGLRLLGGRDIDLEIAAGQWARWWRHALEVGTSAIDDFRPPAFVALSEVPDLRALMQRHFYNASLWSDGLNDDPRVRAAQSAPAIGLNALVRDLPDMLGRRPRPFDLKITVVGVQTKRAWVLAPDHLLLTRHLIADRENAVDWLRPRILALT
ncbi:hypothetical protein ACVBEQ_21000 [Nakamurella sp. GG22]